MHHTIISRKCIWCTAKHKDNHIQHNGIIGLLLKHRHRWPILTLAHKTAKWSKKRRFKTLDVFSQRIKHDTMAFGNIKYGMATYMTCGPS